jgi:hypothetical protein
MAMHNFEATNGVLPTEAGARPSLYVQIQPFIGKSPPASSVPQFLCTSRRTTGDAPGKRDYGYAGSNGVGSVGTSILDSASPLALHKISNLNGTSNTLLLSHLWMYPQHYESGDPTDLGWTTTNNSRSINDTAKRDFDSSGSTAHMGSVHSKGMPSLFADVHVANIPYDWPHWSKAWAYDNSEGFPLP